MKRAFLAALLTLSAGAAFAADPAAEAEKQKALANPYANDLGPATVDVSAYPKEHQDAYKNVLLVKCQKCYTAARPLNSQFFEVPGKKEEKAGNLAKLQSGQKVLFSNKNVWQVETDIWQRYVKRMMSKPGCDISDVEGKAVYRFLVYDSEQRKSGKNAAAWKTHREKLLADFKAKYPARYKELYEGQ
ncbi:MAG TPA: hypothetical protein PKZ00_08780 [Elusimicrobiota bacterium]|nr:hypothetical protein [Elusimicrobiota bacterium]